MKTTQTLTAITASLLLAGCGPQPARDVPEPPMPPGASTTPEVNAPPTPVLQAEVPKALPTPMAGKEQFLASVEKKLKVLDEQVAALGEPSDEYGRTSLSSWQELRTKADAKFAEIKQAGGDAWERIKPELDGVMTELEKSYKDLKAKVST